MSARRNLSALPILVDDVIRERFWSKVRRTDSCWLWTAANRGNGYGCMRVSRMLIDSHVLSWRIENNGSPLPPGMIVCHRCDVRGCVRPDHLFLGTYSDNLRDSMSKGRTFLRGEQKGNAVLNDNAVREIRRMNRDGFGATRIARALNLNRYAIRGVLEGRSWRHVTD